MNLFVTDTLSVVSCVSFLLLCAVTAASAPRRELQTGSSSATMGLLLAGALLAYLASSLPIFWVGWTLTGLPYLLNWSGAGKSRKIALSASICLIAAACVLPSGNLAFAALVLAALLRFGIFPFHFQILDTFEQTSLPALSLLLNSHLGAYLLIRFAIPLMPEIAARWLPYLSLLALFTSVYAAIAALAENRPRRLLGLLWISQAAFILGGIGNRTVEGITGALVHWWVVSFAMSGMIAVYGAIEARTSEVTELLTGNLGLGTHAPRLACFFAICAFALVGLPGTLGFVAEDLLFHGGLVAQPLVGVALPLATALNAVTVFRLFTTLFMGKRANQSTPIPDALPRERLALVVTVMLLVAGGLVPSLFVGLRTPSAARLAEMLAPCMATANALESILPILSKMALAACMPV